MQLDEDCLYCLLALIFEIDEYSLDYECAGLKQSLDRAEAAVSSNIM